MTTPSPPPSPDRAADEPERDPWLSHALRHAPDANAAPSPELSDAILRAARAAVRPAAPTVARSRASRLMTWWSWLARPPIAAGFATVMVAVLVGVMWFDQPLDATIARRADAPTPAPTAPPEPPPMAATPAQPPEPTSPIAETTAPRAAAEAVQDAAKKDSAGRGATARESEAEARRVAPRPALAAKREESKPATAPSPSPPPPPAAPMATPTPAPFSDNTAPAPARDEALAERRGSAESAGALAKAAPSAQSAMALRARSASPVSPLLIDAPERWRWQRGGADAPRAMTPALQRWIAELNQSARWEPSASLGAAYAPGGGGALMLWRDGAPYATLQIGADAVRLQLLNGGGTLSTALEPATAAALQSSLLAATP